MTTRASGAPSTAAWALRRRLLKTAESASSSTGKSRSRSASDRPGAAHPCPRLAPLGLDRGDPAATAPRRRGGCAGPSSAARRARRRAGRAGGDRSRRARRDRRAARAVASSSARASSRVRARRRPARAPAAAAAPPRRAPRAPGDRRSPATTTEVGRGSVRARAISSGGTCGSSAAPITPARCLRTSCRSSATARRHLGEETGSLPQRRLDGPAAPAASDQQHEQRTAPAPRQQAPCGAAGASAGSPRRRASDGRELVARAASAAGTQPSAAAGVFAARASAAAGARAGRGGTSRRRPPRSPAGPAPTRPRRRRGRPLARAARRSAGRSSLSGSLASRRASRASAPRSPLAAGHLVAAAGRGALVGVFVDHPDRHQAVRPAARACRSRPARAAPRRVDLRSIECGPAGEGRGARRRRVRCAPTDRFSPSPARSARASARCSGLGSRAT